MRARELSILMLVGLTLVAVACGSDGTNASAKTTQTITTSNPGTTVPTSTTPKVPFSAGLAGMQANLTAAKGDACKLYNFSNDLAAVGAPSSADENKAAVALLAQYFREIADVLQTDHASQATDLRNETVKFTQQAESADYNIQAKSITAPNDKAFQQAYTTFQQSASSCATTTTTAAGSPTP